MNQKEMSEKITSMFNNVMEESKKIAFECQKSDIDIKLYINDMVMNGCNLHAMILALALGGDVKKHIKTR